MPAYTSCLRASMQGQMSAPGQGAQPAAITASVLIPAMGSALTWASVFIVVTPMRTPVKEPGPKPAPRASISERATPES